MRRLMWCVVELSLTVPITNSLAFLFTVLGEWWAEGKVISRGMLNWNCFAVIEDGADLDRYLDRDGAGAGRDWAVCAE